MLKRTKIERNLSYIGKKLNEICHKDNRLKERYV